MSPPKLSLLLRVLDAVRPPRRMPTLRDVENGLRDVLRHDPLKAERAIGQMYGNAFKKAEAAYNGASKTPYHDHLDVCAHCASHPFDLCPTGAKAMQREARTL